MLSEVSVHGHLAMWLWNYGSIVYYGGECVAEETTHLRVSRNPKWERTGKYLDMPFQGTVLVTFFTDLTKYPTLTTQKTFIQLTFLGPQGLAPRQESMVVESDIEKLLLTSWTGSTERRDRRDREINPSGHTPSDPPLPSRCHLLTAG